MRYEPYPSRGMLPRKQPLRRAIAGAALAAFLLGPAVAQEEEAHFRDEDAGFSVWFPSPPGKQSGTHPFVLADGRTLTVPSAVYTARDENNAYTVTVADLRGTPADHPNAIDLAVASVGREGEVKLDLETSVSSGVCGRDLSVAGRDGSLSTYALFFQHLSTHKLYIFQAKPLSAATADDGGADALRFQQSVDFVGSAAVKEAPETDDDRRWTRYFFHGSRFSMRFPARPDVTVGTYTTAKGVKTRALVYTARQGKDLYRVTIADLWHTSADDEDAIDQAVSVLGKRDKVVSRVTTNISGGQCGRDLQFAAPKPASAISAVVFPSVSHWLYIIEARAVSPTAAADAARFRRSLKLYWKLDGSPPN